MNVKLYKRRENSDYYKHINYSLNNNDFNTQGIIQEKLITINNNSIPIPRENRIKELEITLKPKKMNRIISPKNEPYLKPKLKLKNRNSFCINNKKSKNKEKNIFTKNNETNDINLNKSEIFCDGNGKKMKIINYKNIFKENKQNNKIINENKENYSNNKKVRKNYINEYSTIRKSKKKGGGKNEQKLKYLYTDTPSQSTTTENKSDTKSRKTQTKNGTTNSKKQTNNKNKSGINEKTKIIKENIYYDNLPLFLQKKKQFKKICRTYKDIYNDNKKINNNDKMHLLEKTMNNNKSGIIKDLLIKKINFNNIRRETSNESNIEKKKRFISHKNNLSLNITYDKENIRQILEKENNNKGKNGNNNIKKLYISSVKTRNVGESKKINFNDLDNINYFNHSNKNAERNTIQFPENYLFNFFRNKKKDFFRNNSLGNQNPNLTNNSSLIASIDSLFLDQQNLSFNNNLIRNKTINQLTEHNKNILNKTKNILKFNENQRFCSNQNSKKYLVLDNYESNFNRYPKRIIQQSHKNFREKIINIPNVSYIINSNTMKECHNESLPNNIFNRNKRPCSLYFNKNNIIKKENQGNISLNDYYQNDIYKNNNLTINNININQNNLGFNRHIYKNFQTFENNKEMDINNNINKLNKFNINLKKFISNNNQNNSSENLYKEINNQRMNNNNIFKFNRNKINIRHSHNTSLNYIPSILSLKGAKIE